MDLVLVDVGSDLEDLGGLVSEGPWVGAVELIAAVAAGGGLAGDRADEAFGGNQRAGRAAMPGLCASFLAGAWQGRRVAGVLRKTGLEIVDFDLEVGHLSDESFDQGPSLDRQSVPESMWRRWR